MEWIIHHRRMRKKGRHSSTVKLKFIHNFLLSIKINLDTHHRCKNCEEIKSNTTPHDHFLQCFKSTSLQTNRLLLITNIFLTTHTPLSIVTIITKGLTSYYNGKDTTDTSRFTGKDLHIVQHQNAIGLDNFVKGSISKIFRREVARYYKQLNSTHILIS